MGKPVVLLVDNNRLVVDLIENFLEDEGYDIVRAYDGLEAIDRIHERRPDIIVTDLIMPKIDGKRLCRYVRALPELAAIPLIVLSGTASEDREDFHEAQADAYLAKCSYSTLLPNIKRVVEELLKSPADRTISKSIIGIEEIHPRELVKEFTIIKKHYDAILESMMEGVVELDSKGRVIMLNPVALRLLGKPEHGIIGRRAEELFDGGARAEVEAMVRGLPDGKTPPRTIEIRSDGKTLSLRFAPIVRGDAFHGYFLTMDDVTRRAELETEARGYTRRLEEEVAERTRELQRRNAELEHANKLKDEFLGVLSHELRTPITPIKGYIELLRDHQGDLDLQRKALGVLKKQADHLEQMLTDLLDLTAAEAGRIRLEIQPCRVGDVIDQVCDALAPQALERSITVQRELEPSLAVMADPDRLAQVMSGILSNAIKFSHEEGIVTVRCGRAGDRVAMAVVDRGIGIAPEDMALIFERFRQADGSLTRRYSGLGIGLTLAKRLVDLMGGAIAVDSERGKGSTFTLTLPSA